jgi:hypothetical protein
MAIVQTLGLVHRLKLTDTLILAWAYIGPDPATAELLVILQPIGLAPEEAAFRGAMAEALSMALATRQPVMAYHQDNSAEITMLQLQA